MSKEVNMSTGPPQPGQPQVTVEMKQHGIIVRALYFIFIGWWWGLVVAFFGWFLYATVIGAPLGIKVLNAVPGAISLKGREKQLKLTQTQEGYEVTTERIEQRRWWIRVLWYPFGLVFSFFAILLAWLLCVFLITLPLGIMLFNKVPAIASLYRS
jgi:uncharacterized membrane protein YccF (DUF307 family)